MDFADLLLVIESVIFSLLVMAGMGVYVVRKARKRTKRRR